MLDFLGVGYHGGSRMAWVSSRWVFEAAILKNKIWVLMVCFTLKNLDGPVLAMEDMAVVS